MRHPLPIEKALRYSALIFDGAHAPDGLTLSHQLRKIMSLCCEALHCAQGNEDICVSAFDKALASGTCPQIRGMTRSTFASFQWQVGGQQEQRHCPHLEGA